MPLPTNATLVATAAAIVAAEGQAVTYTPEGGAPKNVTGVWTPQKQDPARGGPREALARGFVQLKPTDAPAPSMRDAFTIVGVNFAVERIRHVLLFVVFELVEAVPE